MSVGYILLIIGIITLVVIGVLVFLFIMGNFRRGVNDTCDRNYNCANGACGRQTAADNAPLICCPSGELDVYAGFDYCTQMPNGSTCWTDAMCASNYCEGNAEGLERGTCAGGATAGAACTGNSDCLNGACGRQTAATGAPLICCPSGETDLFAGFDYCTEMPDGSVCWTDAMCNSDYCKGSAAERGICTELAPSGATCSSNSDCENDACGRQTAATGAVLICCPSGDTDLFAGFDYCTEMPDGSVCWTDAMCASDYCKGPDAEKGICTELAPVGATCSSNSDCENDACGRQTAATGAPLICCPSGDTDLFGGFDYCTEMPDGSVCWSDAMCNSSYCQGNDGGLERGICVELVPAGGTCGVNDDCQNDACGRQTAADGAPLICCPSGELDVYGGFDYCTEMPNGSTCWSDAMCASGYCEGNAGGLERGTCNNRS